MSANIVADLAKLSLDNGNISKFHLKPMTLSINVTTNKANISISMKQTQ